MEESGIIGWTPEGNPIWIHDPNARLEYWINLADWLPIGDLLDGGVGKSDVTAEAPLVIENVEIQQGNRLIGWVAETPTATGDLEVYFRIVTTDDRRDDRTIVLRCRER